ncbi:hypothetical protein FB192DRAFT_1277050 [Mucor lusitanicus]|uniref:Uncharacterized protein n=1 Tax=Mucor circinelloides f. lusitanicus TaxID=29924 RepID=A0A8H4BMC3_MUCCL|nr:hypothetical protein FB192DRAFT_1277050 [Mucor lusitanicus]
MTILEYWAENGVADPTIRIPTDDSELTWYRRACTVLDPLLKDSRLTMLDGETTCKASKSIAKDYEAIYGNRIPLNRGFGRRIDLLLSAREVELSTNEWKCYGVVGCEQCLTQQTKNIRMNKAILSKLLELPIPDEANNVYILGMDWTGMQS